MTAIANELMTLVVLGVISVFLAFKLKITIKNFSKARSLSFWLAAFCFALGLASRSSHIYPALTALTGLNNLAWYLGRLFFTASVYLYTFGFALSQPENRRKLRWMTYGLLFTLSAITVSFWGAPASAANDAYANLLIPTDRTSLIIVALLFSYASVMLLSVSFDVYRLFGQETVLSAKIRWFFVLLLNLHGVLLFSSRFVMATAGYFFTPGQPVLEAMSVYIGVMQAPILLWPLAFVSSRYYDLVLIKPLTYLKNLLILRNFITLKQACADLAPGLFSPALLNPITPWQYLRHPDRCIYKILIAILDYKNGLARQPLPAADNDNAWVSQLINIDDDLDYQDQLTSYSRLGRRIRQQKTKNLHRSIAAKLLPVS